MESKWLEDFITLSETRSFSRAAELRNVTQPAFSRRIQAMEAWVGSDLIDRSSYPTKLTSAGQVFHEQAIEMLSQINGVRALLRGKQSGGKNLIRFAVPHNLAITFFPQWLTELERGLGRLNTRLSAFNVHDAILQLVDGGCDLVMAYHHPRVPIHLDPQRYEVLTLGTEFMRAYSIPKGIPKAEKTTAAKFSLPGTKASPMPFLSFTSAAYLGRMSDVIVTEAQFPQYLSTVFETDMAEVIKMMALAGHGIALLPESAVLADVAAGRLVSAGNLCAEMEIRLIRERPKTLNHDTNQDLKHSPAAALWDYVAKKL